MRCPRQAGCWQGAQRRQPVRVALWQQQQLMPAVSAPSTAPLQVIAECPPARRPNLVFCQNGMLLPLLEQHGLEGNTTALLYLSAAADGSYTDGRQTVVCGRWGGSREGLLWRCWQAAGWGHVAAALCPCYNHSAPAIRPAMCHLHQWEQHACYTPFSPCTALHRWADAFAALLHRGGLACRVVDRGKFSALMIEKLLCEWWVEGCLAAGCGSLSRR